jgi:hypothetical protein
MSRPVQTAVAVALILGALAIPQRESFAATETRRLCDRRVSYNVKPPTAEVPARLSMLSGVWKGSVRFAGGGEMCVSMVVKEVFPDGKVVLLMTWNVSMGGREDINNVVGLGEALDWHNKVENGELRIDSGTRYRGTRYYYVMKVPDDATPDVMRGVWMTDNHPQPVVLYRDKR